MKKAIAIFLSFLLIFMLTCCKGETEESVNANSEDSQEVVSNKEETKPSDNPIANQPEQTPEEKPKFEDDTNHTSLKKEEYYQYSALKQDEKKLYNRFVKAAENFENVIDTTEYKLTEEEVKKVHAAFMADNPQYFYIAKSCSYVVNSKDNFITEFVFCYFDGTNTDTFDINGNAQNVADRNLINSQIENFNNKINAILSVIPVEHSSLQKEKIIYEYIIDTVNYDEKTATTYLNNGSAFSDSFTSFGALLKGSAVCEGYVKLFQWLCYKMGINATPVESGNNMSHMWVAVNLDGIWYMADPTWDDADNSLVCFYKYFNVTKDFLSEDHSFGSKLAIPECTSDQAAFHKNYALRVENGKFLENYKDIIDLAVLNSAKYIYIYRGNSADYKELIDTQIYSGEIGDYIASKNIKLSIEYYHTDNYYFIPIEASDNF